jgi:hypothetical protein
MSLTIHVRFEDDDDPMFERLRQKRTQRPKRKGGQAMARKRRKATRSIHKDIRHAVDAVKQGSFEEGTRRTLALVGA